MTKKPSYEELEQRVKELELENSNLNTSILQVEKSSSHKNDGLRKFKNISDSANYGAAISDIEGNLSYVNKYFASIHGYGQDYLHGKHLSIFHNNEQLKLVEETLNTVKKKGEISSVEVWHTHRDGSVFPMLMNLFEIKDSEEDIQYFATTAIDITARKEAEEKLINSEARFKRLADNLPVVLYQFMISPDGAFTFPYVSDKATAIIGISPEDIMQDSSKFFNSVYPEDREMFRESIMKSAETFESFPVVFRYMKGEEVVWLEACGTPRKPVDGFKLWDGFIFDITERKQMEENLRSSEKRFRDISLAGGNWLWEIDTKCVYTYCTENITNILGYSLNEIVGKPIYDFMLPEEAERVRSAFNRFVKNKETIEDEESTRITKDGRLLYFLTNGVPIFNKKGEVTGYRGSGKDITARKNVEENLRVAQERLSLALKGSASGLWDWNIETGYVVYDELWCKMLGYEQSELKHNISTWEKLLHPDDKNKVMEKLNRHFKDQKYNYSPEFRMKMTSGVWKWIIARGEVSERNQDGKPLRMLGIHNDITERKKLEFALESSEKQLQGLLDNSPDMIVHIGTNNKITWANKTVLDLFPKAVGKVCVFSDSNKPCENCPVKKALKTAPSKKP